MDLEHPPTGPMQDIETYETMRAEFDIGFYIVGLALIFIVLHCSGIRQK